MVGCISLCRLTNAVLMDVWYMLQKDHRWQGFGTSGAARVLKHCYEEFRLKNICPVAQVDGRWLWRFIWQSSTEVWDKILFGKIILHIVTSGEFHLAIAKRLRDLYQFCTVFNMFKSPLALPYVKRSSISTGLRLTFTSFNRHNSNKRWYAFHNIIEGADGFEIDNLRRCKIAQSAAYLPPSGLRGRMDSKYAWRFRVKPARPVSAVAQYITRKHGMQSSWEKRYVHEHPLDVRLLDKFCEAIFLHLLALAYDT